MWGRQSQLLELNSQTYATHKNITLPFSVKMSVSIHSIAPGLACKAIPFFPVSWFCKVEVSHVTWRRGSSDPSVSVLIP